MVVYCYPTALYFLYFRFVGCVKFGMDYVLVGGGYGGERDEGS